MVQRVCTSFIFGCSPQSPVNHLFADSYNPVGWVAKTWSSWDKLWIISNLVGWIAYLVLLLLFFSSSISITCSSSVLWIHTFGTSVPGRVLCWYKDKAQHLDRFSNKTWWQTIPFPSETSLSSRREFWKTSLKVSWFAMISLVQLTHITSSNVIPHCSPQPLSNRQFQQFVLW